jgi:hypothetical protein
MACFRPVFSEWALSAPGGRCRRVGGHIRQEWSDSRLGSRAPGLDVLSHHIQRDADTHSFAKLSAHAENAGAAGVCVDSGDCPQLTGLKTKSRKMAHFVVAGYFTAAVTRQCSSSAAV